MSTTKSTSHVSLKSRDTSVMKGIDKHITTNFTIAGTTYTPAELKALFQSEITAIEASDGMRKSLADSVQNVKTVSATVNEEAKALAKAKRAATRAARHTMGSVQKKAVTGNVIAVTTTPVIEGAPVPSTAPVTPEPPAGTRTQVG